MQMAGDKVITKRTVKVALTINSRLPAALDFRLIILLRTDLLALI